MLLGGLVHESLCSPDASKEVSQIFFVLDTGTVVTIIELGSKSCSTNFFGEHFTIKWSWHIFIFSLSKVFDRSSVITTRFRFEISFILVDLSILVTAFRCFGFVVFMLFLVGFGFSLLSLLGFFLLLLDCFLLLLFGSYCLLLLDGLLLCLLDSLRFFLGGFLLLSFVLVLGAFFSLS